MITPEERFDRLEAAAAEGRLLPSTFAVKGDLDWKHYDRTGEVRYLGPVSYGMLAALAPECGYLGDWTEELQKIMPLWAASAAANFSLFVSTARWCHVIRRFVPLVRPASRLTPEQWDEIRVGWLADDIIPTMIQHVSLDEFEAIPGVLGVRSALRLGNDAMAAAMKRLEPRVPTKYVRDPVLRRGIVALRDYIQDPAEVAYLVAKALCFDLVEDDRPTSRPQWRFDDQLIDRIEAAIQGRTIPPALEPKLVQRGYKAKSPVDHTAIAGKYRRPS